MYDHGLCIDDKAYAKAALAVAKANHTRVANRLLSTINSFTEDKRQYILHEVDRLETLRLALQDAYVRFLLITESEDRSGLYDNNNLHRSVLEQICSLPTSTPIPAVLQSTTMPVQHASDATAINGLHTCYNVTARLGLAQTSTRPVEQADFSQVKSSATMANGKAFAPATFPSDPATEPIVNTNTPSRHIVSRQDSVPGLDPNVMSSDEPSYIAQPQPTNRPVEQADYSQVKSYATMANGKAFAPATFLPDPATEPMVSVQTTSPQIVSRQESVPSLESYAMSSEKSACITTNCEKTVPDRTFDRTLDICTFTPTMSEIPSSANLNVFYVAIGKLWRYLSKSGHDHEWDQPSSSNQDTHWRLLFNTSTRLNQIPVPRPLSHPPCDDNTALVVINDTSTIFTACVYVRLPTSDSEIVLAQTDMDCHQPSAYAAHPIAEIVNLTSREHWWFASSHDIPCADFSRVTTYDGLRSGVSTWQNGPQRPSPPRTEWLVQHRRRTATPIPELRTDILWHCCTMMLHPSCNDTHRLNSIDNIIILQYGATYGMSRNYAAPGSPWQNLVIETSSKIFENYLPSV